jgi:ABC-2 type transport system permease protein
MTLAPGWLETVSEFNRITYVVDGTRAVFRGDIVSSEAGIGFAITLVLVALGVVYGTRMFRRESA